MAEKTAAMATARCHELLRKRQASGNETFDFDLVTGGNDGIWCNATSEGFLCWPATRANEAAVQQCPPFQQFNPTKTITKRCLANGRWRGLNDTDTSRPHGYTDFSPCFVTGWNQLLANLGTEGLNIAQNIANRARIVEFVGLALSFVSLLGAVIIFARFRRLWVFRNLVHLQLMIAIWIVIIIRLVLYIDHAITKILGAEVTSTDVVLGQTINSSKYVCEFFFLTLEYAKTVAFAWMLIEGFHLHHVIVWSVFQTEPKLWKFCVIGWGLPLIHVIVWLVVVVVRHGGPSEVPKCLGSYFLQSEFWILDGIRMGELLLNLLFLLNVMRILWHKLIESHMGAELAQAKKSVRAALMLLPLLGVPNILQTVQFAPTKENLSVFAAYTYTASFTYMYQGFFVAVLYCFTNREVLEVLKLHWHRFVLQHRSAEYFRRGSRAGRHLSRANNEELLHLQQNRIRFSSSCAEESPDIANFCGNTPRDSADSARSQLTLLQLDRVRLSDKSDSFSSSESPPVTAMRNGNAMHSAVEEFSLLSQNGNVLL